MKNNKIQEEINVYDDVNMFNKVRLGKMYLYRNRRANTMKNIIQ